MHRAMMERVVIRVLLNLTSFAFQPYAEIMSLYHERNPDISKFPISGIES